MEKKKIYCSHSIQGKYGKDATEQQMIDNCNKAKVFVSHLRQCFPEFEFYLPADHELFVHKTYQMKLLSIKQILDVDCNIVKECDGILAYAFDGHISNGMRVEIDYAQKMEISQCRVCRDLSTKSHFNDWFYALWEFLGTL